LLPVRIGSVDIDCANNGSAECIEELDGPDVIEVNDEIWSVYSYGSSAILN